jgi:hypothetical protein
MPTNQEKRELCPKFRQMDTFWGTSSEPHAIANQTLSGLADLMHKASRKSDVAPFLDTTGAVDGSRSHLSLLAFDSSPRAGCYGFSSRFGLGSQPGHERRGL